MRESFPKLLLCWLACVAMVPGLGLGQAAGQGSDAPERKATKYPLRLHVLAMDDTHRTVRMQPDWCSSSVPDMSGADTAPCSNGGSSSLGGGDDDFAGTGRADLVTPPSSTMGLSFTYEGCSRVRVAPGFQGLEARWLKPGSKLQVLIPTDAITEGRVQTQRCTLRVITHDFVYLRLHNGAIVRVSQEAYWNKPALRVFLKGGSETLERRSPVVSVNDLAPSPPHQ